MILVQCSPKKSTKKWPYSGMMLQKKHRDLKTNHIGKNEPCDEKDVLLEKGVWSVSLLC